MERTLGPIVSKISLKKETGMMSSEQDEGFINEMILVSANRVVGSK